MCAYFWQIESPDISPPPHKIILFWTKIFALDDYACFGLGNTPFVKAQCGRGGGSDACRTTKDRNLLNQSDAIIFHAADLNCNDLPPPAWRSPHQHYIFFNFESPMLTDLIKLRLYFGNYFNRTMTYRRNSDIVSLYGRIRCKSPQGCFDFPRSEIQNLSDYKSYVDLTTKNRTAAWFVSHCSTNGQRESFVRNLLRYIPIDIYGNCEGGKKCVRGSDCNNMLSKHYRFYLSFENALCPDYITEKLYRPMHYDTVPVVFGGADYAAYLPPGSYIDARNFSTPVELANYLKRLMEDDELYLSYFRWRKEFIVDRAPMDGWCHLCQFLNDAANIKAKTYPDIAAWWDGTLTNQSCFPPPSSLVNL